MTCWRCSNREEYSELGLCRQCREELDAEIPYPPPLGATLLAKGTLPEEIGPYRVPLPQEYRTYPTGADL